MALREFLKLKRTPPQQLVISVLLCVACAIENTLRQCSMDTIVGDVAFLVCFIPLCFFALKGEKWARKILIVTAFILGIMFSDDKESFFQEMEGLTFFCLAIVLHLPDVRSFFGLNVMSNPSRYPYPIKKYCPACSHHLTLAEYFKLARGHSFLCSSCQTPLKWTYNAENTTLYNLIALELFLLPIFAVFLAIDDLGVAAFLFIIPMSALGLCLKLKLHDLVVFKPINNQCLDNWAKGDQVGKTPSEVGQEMIVDSSYDSTFVRCKKAIEAIGGKIYFENDDYGIIQGTTQQYRNHYYNEQILFNLVGNDNSCKISVYCRRAGKLQPYHPRSEYVVKEICKYLKGEKTRNIVKDFKVIYWLLFTSFVLAIISLGFLLVLKTSGFEVVNNTFFDKGFFFITLIVHCAIAYFLQGKIKKIPLFGSFYFYSNKNNALLQPFSQFSYQIMFLPLSLLFMTGLYYSNIAFDESAPQLVIAQTGELQKKSKTDPNTHKDVTEYCYDLIFNETSILHRPFCLNEFENLHRGDKIEIMKRKGLLGVPWAQTVSIKKYQDIAKLVQESGGVSHITYQDLKHINKDHNFRSIASLWETECSTSKGHYCRLSSYIKALDEQYPEGHKLLQDACQSGDNLSCFELFHGDAMEKFKAENYKEKIKDDCEIKNDVESCYFWGLILEKSNHDTDHKKIKSYFSNACERNIHNSCLSLNIFEADKNTGSVEH